MKIQKLELTDFRGFKGKVTIDFPDDLAVFVGINGSGKSSVLDGVAFLMGQYIFDTTGVSNKIINIEKEDININSTETLIQIWIERNRDEFHPNFHPRFHWAFLKSFSEEKRMWHFSLESFGREFQKVVNENEMKNIPLIVYYSTTRIFSQNGTTNTSQQFIAPQAEAYDKAFNKNVEFSSFIHWFIEESNIENQIKIQQKNFDATNSKLDAIRTALTLFLQNFPYARFKNPRVGISKMSAKKSKKQTLLIDKNDEELELAQLSDGEKGALLLVFDIAYRLSIANPSLENPLQGKGVVMIDEIDLHLHPSWQKSIIKCLRATFPNIQFIVTTHSPLVINHVKKENIFLLENNTCTPLKDKLPQLNTYGAEVEEILKVVQQTPELLPQDVTKQLDLYFDLIDNNQIEEAKKMQKVLKKMIDPQHPELLKGQTFIDLRMKIV